MTSVRVVCPPKGVRGLPSKRRRAVRVVLQDQDIRAAAYIENRLPPFRGQGDAGGVVEAGDGVEELDVLARGLEGGDLRFEQVRDDAVLVHRHGFDLHLVGLERVEGANVRGVLHEDHVAGIAEDLVATSCADCEPAVITTFAGSASRIPSAAMTSQIWVRSSSVPWPLPYCRAVIPCSAMIFAAVWPRRSSGRDCR